MVNVMSTVGEAVDLLAHECDGSSKVRRETVETIACEVEHLELRERAEGKDVLRCQVIV